MKYSESFTSVKGAFYEKGHMKCNWRCQSHLQLHCNREDHTFFQVVELKFVIRVRGGEELD